MTLAVKTATIIAATLLLFSQDLITIFTDALYSETTSHLLAIPVILAYLIFRKRKMLRATTSLTPQNQQTPTRYLPTIAGILLATIAVLLYWYGSYTFTPLEYHIAALPIFVAGLTLLMFNLQTLRQLAFPIAFLILLAPPPSVIIYGLGGTLSVVGAEVSHAIITAFGIPATLSSAYGNPVIQVTRPNDVTIPFTVDIACSGVYSLIGFIIFAAFVVYIIRDKLWKKAAITATGFGLIYLLNITRITTILFIGYHYGEETALQIFHLLGGWVLIFLGTLLLLTIGERILKTRIFTRTSALPQCQSHTLLRNPHNSCATCGRLLTFPKTKLSKPDIAKIAAIALSISLLLTIQTPIFALTEGPAEIIIEAPTGEEATTEILPEIEGYNLRFAYRDRNFERIAKQDASLVYAYRSTDGARKTLWVTLEIATTQSSMHRWEYCLITWPQTQGYQPEVTQLDLRDIQILDNPPIIARYFAFQFIETNQTQVVLYWFEQSMFQTGTASQQKNVKISVQAYGNSHENILEIEDQLATVATAIARYWQPIKTWTQIAILISQNGDTLTVATTGLLIFVVALFIFERRKERKVSAKAYEKLSRPYKQLVDIIHETEQTTLPTLHNIADSLRKVLGKINKEELLHKLNEMEKAGIITTEITNEEDEPIQTWRPTMTSTRNTKSLLEICKTKLLRTRRV